MDLGILSVRLKLNINTVYQKLSKLAAPDPFTSASSSIKSGDRKVGENKLLSRPGGLKPGGASGSKGKIGNRYSVCLVATIPSKETHRATAIR
jgi:hypothetical protein